VEHPDLIVPPSEGVPAKEEPAPDREFVSEPAKVMRVGSMIKQLLDEVRTGPLDEPSRERLKEIYERSIDELGSAGHLVRAADGGEAAAREHAGSAYAGT
jgi:hypothetical protein